MSERMRDRDRKRGSDRDRGGTERPSLPHPYTLFAGLLFVCGRKPPFRRAICRGVPMNGRLPGKTDSLIKLAVSLLHEKPHGTRRVSNPAIRKDLAART